MGRRWVKVAPHLNDTLLFVSGIALVVTFGFYPLLGMDSWLTEKLFGVIIYILLATSHWARRPKVSGCEPWRSRWRWAVCI